MLLLGLMAAGATVGSVNAVSGDQRIINAVYQNNLVEVEKLIKAGANVNSVSIGGDTVLIDAAYQGNMEILQLLINDPNINLEMANSEGSTALVAAAVQNHLDIVNALLKAGASLTVRKGWTALQVAQYYNDTAIVEALQQAQKKQRNKK